MNWKNKTTKMISIFMVTLFVFSVFLSAITVPVNPSFGQSQPAKSYAQYSDAANTMLPSSIKAENTTVNSTLVLLNNSTYNGNFVNTFNTVNPVSVLFDSQNNLTYIYGDNIVEVNRSNDMVSTISTINPAGYYSPQSLALDPVNHLLYAMGPYEIYVFNTTTSNLVTQIQTKGSFIAYNPSNNLIYVGHANSNYVSLINTTSNTVTSTIVFANPQSSGYVGGGIAYDSANGITYVANPDVQNLSGLNSKNQIVQNISVANASQVIYDPVNGYLFVYNCGNGTISVIDPSTDTYIKNLSARGLIMQLAFDPANDYVYYTNDTGGSADYVNYINTTTYQIGSLQVGTSPSGIAFNSANDNMYVADNENNSVSIISPSNSVTNKTLGMAPEGIAYDPVVNSLFISNTFSDIVTVVNASTGAIIRAVNLVASNSSLESIADLQSAIAYDPVNGLILVGTQFSYGLFELNPINYSVTYQPIYLDYPNAMWVNPVNGLLYATSTQFEGVEMFDISNGSVVGSLHTSSIMGGMTYDQNDGILYVTNSFNDSIIEVNITTNTVSGQLNLGYSLNGALLFDPYNNYFYGEPFAYSPNSGTSAGTGNEIIISTGSGQVVQKLNVGIVGTASYNILAVGNAPDRVYSVNAITGTISFLTTTIINEYLASFNQTGIPSGDAWSVNIYSSQGAIVSQNSSTSSNIVFYLPNGTYTFSAYTSYDYAAVSNASGSFSVSGSGIGFMAIFELTKYGVTFSEDGLPQGSVWYVNLSGGLTSGPVNSSSYTFDLYSGNYNYSIGSNTSMVATPSRGTFGVYGNMTLSINFSNTSSENAYIALTVSPGTAHAYLNGLSINLSSGLNTLVVSPGWYYLNVTKSGYSSFTGLYDLKAGENLSIDVTLMAFQSYGFLSGTISPGNASISANGISIPMANGLFNETLAPGVYYVSVTAYGYDSIFKEINITQGKVTYLNVTLSNKTSSFMISGYLLPVNASIVFGEYTSLVNATGYYQVSLPEGQYNISVTANGYYSETYSLTLVHNIIDLNFTLAKEPQATSSISGSNVTVTGYNVTVSNLSSASGYISVDYNSNPNGTLTVSIPYSEVQNATISELMNSKVYINSVLYKNFTVAISSLNGTYEVILTVYNLSGDPNLVWAYSASAVIPTLKNTGSGIPPKELYYVAIITAVAGLVALSVTLLRRTRR